MTPMRQVVLLLLSFCLLLPKANAETSETTEAIVLQRDGLSHLIQYMDNHPELFARETGVTELLNRVQRQQILDVWSLYLNYMSALNELTDQTGDYRALSGPARKYRYHEHVMAFNSHYRFGMEFTRRISHDPELTDWLNTPHPDLNLPKNFYLRFSSELLSDWMTDRFDHLNASVSIDPDYPQSEIMQADLNHISHLDRMELLTEHTLRTIRRTAYNTYYPLQKGVARGMGKVKLWRINHTLITPQQALAFSYQLEPGDFYLTRKEWRLTNIGIPGFWTHSAMYIGTPEERNRYFDTPEVDEWLEQQGYSSFEAMLQSVSSEYARHPGVDEQGQIRVLEALDAGVIFNSIETSMDADGVAVFRPLTTRLEKAKAIAEAFHFTGRPYDFHFDFDSDTALVCSELIYKAYQPSDEQDGVSFPLNRAVGRKMLTPNEIAQWYTETAGTDEQQIELVMFVDSNEAEGVAFQSSADAFMTSWQRSDWYFLQQSARPTTSLASAQNTKQDSELD